MWCCEMCRMGVWIFCVLCVCCDLTWSFPTRPPSEPRKEEFLMPDSHHNQLIETIEAGKNNTLNLIQEVAHSDLHTEPNPSSDSVLKVIEYSKTKPNKFQTDSIKGSEWKKAGLIFEYSAKKSGKPESLSLSRREALQQADVAEGDASWSTMVLTIASTLVALFSMSVLVAVFQCCCRRRKRNSSPEIDNNEEKQTADDQNKNNEKPGKEEAIKQNNVEKKTGEDSKENTDEKLSFKDKLKAFEKKDESKEAQHRPGPTPKKRPQSEAFKAFEAKGLPIMGMPKGQGPRFPKPKEPQNEKEEAEVTLRPKITVTLSPDAVSDSGSYKQPDNPDVVIADEDEDDSEFGAIKRETAVLRSYRKAPPPKNRNRSSAAFRRKNAQQSTANLISEDTESEPLLTPDDKRHQKKEDAVNSSDKTDQEPDQSKKKILVPKERSRSKTPEKLDSKNSSEKSAPKTVSEKPGPKTFDKNGSKTPNGTGSKTPDTPGSKTPDKSGSKTPDKAGSKTPDKAGSKTPIKERSKTPDRSGSKTPEEKLTIGNSRDPDSQPSAASPLGGNIFAQIDPTVKKSSPAPSTPSSLDTRSRADKVKSSPGFLEDDKLMKALNERLKAQQDGNDDKQHNRRSLNTDL